MVDREISNAVEEVYRWIDSQGIEHTCSGCGECCNFTEFDHLLFVTAVELIHFVNKVGPDNIKPMKDGICPYRVDSKCTVYENRFAGCRIFQCKGDEEKQSEVMEKALEKFKQIGENYEIDYSYLDLKRGLDSIKK